MTQLRKTSQLWRRVVLGASTCFMSMFVFLLGSCSKDAEKQPRAPETSGTLSANETVATQIETRVLTEAEVQTLLSLQERIVQQPEDVASRRALGQKAIDADAGVVWAVGQAKISSTAASRNVAQSQAELAARIVASRWAAYLLEWHKNDYATNIGAIHAHVPAGEVARKIVTDSTCVVVMRTSLR